jgi:rhomboid protease GluP
VTNFLITINILVFCAELVWQSQPGHQGMSFLNGGGLFAPRVIAGEWWRLVTANFLHLGILHLVLNMLGLMYLGKFVEDWLGTFRFSLIYAISGLGSMLAITYFDTQWPTKIPQVTVGASGAIMGLLGAMGAIHLMGWQQGKVKSAAREFRVVFFSVALQLAFDLANGHTSIVGHFSGLIVGFIAGLVLLLFRI